MPSRQAASILAENETHKPLENKMNISPKACRNKSAMRTSILAIPLVLIATQTMSQNSNGQEGMELQNDIDLITRCSHAARYVVKAAELQPNSKDNRDLLLAAVVEDARKPGRLGSQAPTVLNLHFAKIDDMLARSPDLSNQNTRDWHLAQSAASCALNSYRSKQR